MCDHCVNETLAAMSPHILSRKQKNVLSEKKTLPAHLS